MWKKNCLVLFVFCFSAFFWLLSLLFASIFYALIKVNQEEKYWHLVVGLVTSIAFQELFRFLIYLLLSKADAYLRKLTENESTRIFANRHILAYGM